MKKLHVLSLLLFVFALCTVHSTYGQAEVVFDKSVYFKDFATGESYESIDSKTTLTPSGNIVKKASFQLPGDHRLVPDKGKKYITVVMKTVDINGIEKILADLDVAIGKSGKFQVVLHLNGSGEITPNY